MPLWGTTMNENVEPVCSGRFSASESLKRSLRTGTNLRESAGDGIPDAGRITKMRIGAWQIREEEPIRLTNISLSLEKYLEDWIETDPTLLQLGLEIVARQLSVDAGFVDLLAIDPQGRWIVIEIKRGQLDRHTIAQVIDYASCLSTMSADDLADKTNTYLKKHHTTIQDLLRERSSEDAIAPEHRDVRLMIVGIGKTTGLDRMVNYLAEQYQMPISVVSFGAFDGEDDKMVLVRELSEPDIQPTTRSKSAYSVEQVCALADKVGIGKNFQRILATANRIGLYPRPYRACIMYTPPFQRNRMLFTVWAEKQDEGLRMYAGPEYFVEFYPVSSDEASSSLGLEYSGYHNMSDSSVHTFATGLETLFKTINERSQ